MRVLQPDDLAYVACLPTCPHFKKQHQHAAQTRDTGNADESNSGLTSGQQSLLRAAFKAYRNMEPVQNAIDRLPLELINMRYCIGKCRDTLLGKICKHGGGPPLLALIAAKVDVTVPVDDTGRSALHLFMVKTVRVYVETARFRQ